MRIAIATVLLVSWACATSCSRAPKTAVVASGAAAHDALPPAPTAGGTRARLPDKPDSAQLVAGIAPSRAEASRCGAGSDAPATTVIVKIRVEGATGTVRDTEVFAPYRGTHLGQCIVDVVAKARFTRFRAETVTVIFPVRL